VRAATIGNLRTENTHPFRYRQWLFAHTGTIDGFSHLRDRLVESVPEFLLRNLRGDTDSELLFHLFLSFLHDAGELVDATIAPAATRAAVRSTLALVDRLCQEEGSYIPPLNLLVSDGEQIVGAHRSASMAYHLVRGKADLERLLGEDMLRQVRIPDMASCRFCLIASDFDNEPSANWARVAPQSIVTVTRTDEPTVEPL